MKILIVEDEDVLRKVLHLFQYLNRKLEQTNLATSSIPIIVPTANIAPENKLAIPYME